MLHDASFEAEQFDPQRGGGVRRAIDEWITERPEAYELLVLEPPFWPGVCGVSLLKRRLRPTKRHDELSGREA